MSDAIQVPPADAASDVAAAWRWTPEFWNEPDEAGASLIRAGMLIQNSITIFEGHFEAGKTALMIDVARQWAEMDRPVFYIDYEMGRRKVRKRMRANCWTEEHLPFWYYDYMPNLQPGLLEQIIAVLPENPLITLDSYSQAMMYMSREENSATEAGNFWVAELQRARDLGATILVIDQVKQSATARDKYAGRGSGAKSFGADVKWFIERYEKFTPTQQGLVKASLVKDREGVLPEALGFKVGDGDGHLTVESTDPPKGSPIHAQAIEAVTDILQSEGWLSPNAIAQRVEGYGYNTVASAVQYMENRGLVQSRKREGRGGGLEYNLTDQSDRAQDVPSLD